MIFEVQNNNEKQIRIVTKIKLSVPGLNKYRFFKDWNYH